MAGRKPEGKSGIALDQYGPGRQPTRTGDRGRCGPAMLPVPGGLSGRSAIELPHFLVATADYGDGQTSAHLNDRPRAP